MSAALPRVVVLGASGFVGRHIIEELERRGVETLAVTRSSTRTVRPGVGWRVVADYADLETEAGDVVVHLAGGNVIGGAGLDVERAVRIGRRLLALPFSRIVFASSAAVYGDEAVHPHTEDEPLRPGSDYARLKATIEGILAADPRCRIARLANVYGPGMSPQNIFSAILAQVGGSGPIMVRDLAPVRDYVDARDVARGLADLALVPAQPGAYNLSTGRGTSVEKLARLVSPRPVVDTAPSNRSSTLILSPEKARHVLGWAPAYTLEAGVRDLLKATA